LQEGLAALAPASEQRPWMKQWKAELVQLVADILFDILEGVE
jgi:hypothetical protein